MFCPKCHTDLDDSLKFCSRCGTELNTKKKTNYFSKTNSFHTTTINSFSGTKKENKNEQEEEKENSHEEQYNYSTEYSKVNENNKTHDEQYKYSKKNSKTTSKQTSHEEQYKYNERYSRAQKKETSHNNQYEYSNNYSNINNKPYVTSDIDYIKAYMGNNYKSIIESKLSFPALFLGPIYLLYRKQIFNGSILLLLLLITNIYFSNDLSNYLFIILNITIAFNFNKNYYENTLKKIESIKSTNSDKTSNELLNICKEKGGTLPIKTIFTIIILFFIVQTILSIFFKYAVIIENPKTNNDNLETIGELKYNKPLGFEETDYNTESYKRYEKKEDLCYITLSEDIYSYNYLTPKDYLLKYSSYNQEINNTNINEIEWYYANNKYVTQINNKLYIFELKNYKDDSNCTNKFNELLNSTQK